MKSLLAVPAVFFLSLGIASADEFVDQFETLKKAGDDAALRKFLETSAKTQAGNPDYYAKAGNYWWGVARSGISISTLKAGTYNLDPKDLSIRDPKTGNPVGSIQGGKKANSPARTRAVALLAEGVRKFPERADLPLGLAHVQKEIGLNESCVKTLTDLLAHAGKDPKALRWTEGGDLPEPAATFLPESVHGYAAALLKVDTPATDALCADLLNATIDAFPGHPYAYNLKAALLDATGKPEEAAAILEIAHRKAPEDPLILSNLAGAYEKLEQTGKAIAAWEKVLKLEALAPQRHRKAEESLAKLRKAE